MKKNALFLVALLSTSILLSGCSLSNILLQKDTSTTVDVVSSSTVSPNAKKAIEVYFENFTNKTSYMLKDVVLKEALDKTPSAYLLLDIRQESDYKAGHIPGAVNVPYGPDIAVNLDKIRSAAKGKTIVVISATGQRANQLNVLLNIVGIDSRALTFGMDYGSLSNGWAIKGFPMTQEVTALPDIKDVKLDTTVPEITIEKVVKYYFNNIPRDSHKISPKVLKTQLDSIPEHYVIVDVRKAEDYANGHIKGAVNIPFQELGKNIDTIEKLSKGKILVVSCYGGQTSSQAVAILNALGIPTSSLDFGFGEPEQPNSWSGDKLPTVK